MAITAPARWSPARAAGFVWRSWGRLSKRHFQYALLAGMSLGTIDGIAVLLYAREASLEDFFLHGFAHFVVLSILLLLTLAIASNVRTERIPRWLPFVVAATVATLGLDVFDFFVTEMLEAAAGIPWPGWQLVLQSYVLESLQKWWPISILVALGYMYGLDTWKRAARLRDVQLERTRLSRKAYESRLQALQARVDPRFLFETLASIETTYAANLALGQHMLDDLIVYLRAALPALNEPSSSLGTELALIRAWLGIMRMRRGERFSFSIDAAESSHDARMPPMFLLPLVEHAADAIADLAGNETVIRIAADVIDGRTRVTVTATGSAFAANGEAPELVPIRERLHALYGPDASFASHLVGNNESQVLLEIPHERTDRRHR